MDDVFAIIYHNLEIHTIQIIMVYPMPAVINVNNCTCSAFVSNLTLVFYIFKWQYKYDYDEIDTLICIWQKQVYLFTQL